MYLIGLTGGIASGKSVVASRLASHGAVVVDADALARRVVEPGTPGLARIAQEFGPTGIHINCVSPGPVATELWLGDHGVAATVAAANGIDVDAARAAVVASIGGFATGRFTTPEEVATLVTLLASARTANVTGANYVIDGGLIKTL